MSRISGLKIILILTSFFWLLPLNQLVQPVYASNITVDGICTLPDAIQSANTDSPVGSCSAGSGADVIILDIDTLLTTVFVSSATLDYSQAGLPDITSEMTIQAGTADTIGSNGGNFRLLQVLPIGSLTLDGLILENAEVSVTSGRASAAAIYNQGTLTLQSTIVRNNLADGKNSSTGPDEGARGGAILNEAGATLTITNSVFENNSVYGAFRLSSDNGNNAHGGAIYNEGTILDINNSTFDGNLAKGFGSTYGSTLHIAGAGGAIFNGGTINQMRNSTLSNNIATTYIPNSNDQSANGAGFYNNGDTLDIYNLTFSGNQAIAHNGTDSYGAGLFNENGILNITHSTFMNNFAEGAGDDVYFRRGTINLNNSLLISTNLTSNCTLEEFASLSGTENLGLVDDTSCNLLILGTIQPGVDIDATLRNNGGDTQTHALVNSGSNPAVDVIPGCGLVTDQRGIARDANCDIGSYEMEAIALTATPSMTPSPTTTATALPDIPLIVDGVCTLFDAIIAANEDAPYGNCPAGNGADTILLDVDTALTTNAFPYSFQILDTYGGLPDIRTDITIEARAASLISGNSSDFRIFQVLNTGKLTLRGVTVTGGRLYADGSNNSLYGGAFFIYPNGSLTLEDSLVMNNGIDIPNGSQNTYTYGGAIYNTGTLIISNTVFSDNHLDVFLDNGAPGMKGGAIYNSSGATLTLQNTVFDNNTITSVYLKNLSLAHGGAIYNEGVITEITDSSFSNNWIEAGGHNIVYPTAHRSLANGGAISNLGTISLIQNSSFISNQVRPESSTIRTDFVSGGAIYNSGSILEVEDNLFADNSAVGGNGFSAYGGAIASEGSIYMLRNSTFSGNWVEATYAEGFGGALYIDPSRYAQPTSK